MKLSKRSHVASVALLVRYWAPKVNIQRRKRIEFRLTT